MGRILAIDYGRKRSGLAVTDTLQLIATGLTTVPSGDLVKFLFDYVSREPVEIFVVGLPKQMNNELSENMKYIDAFVKHLKRTIPDIPVIFVDERFTSVLAHRAMLEGGLKKKKRQDKELVDEISAVIILQSYLESNKYQFKL
ncbi:MAG: Holliday junction resolvase RuvX [Tannerellaceae bacterium]|jgi:putative holliday junction resolvase|nr:Holliday junction resolvase RuvX [Tannerellaceae bacterium]MBP7486657.1 Holliday junction resolvase RuvX [Parabacteroides sp.]MBP8758791.1 Holliday junction resolvase RuvX [Parabacteroides sp.]MBP9480127.1 Holliday junction resolvase RuvX [Parabacteroides sp.]MBP9579512.1 Holliday junction resolvase RuvX [Parabacteroides sp.]